MQNLIIPLLQQENAMAVAACWWTIILGAHGGVAVG